MTEDDGRDMASNTGRRPLRRFVEDHPALFAFGFCGLVGVLIDVDHLLAIVFWRYWLPEITEGRIFHTPLFIVSCLSICYLGTRLRGLYPKLVLGGVLIITALVLAFSPEVIWSWK